MHRAALKACALAALAAVPAALAGCGGGGDTHAVGSVSTSTAALARAQQARIAAYAHAINVRAEDVPGMKAWAPERETGRPPLGVNLHRCDHDPLSDELAAVGSTRYRHRGRIVEVHGRRVLQLPTENVWSTVYVMSSEAVAREDLATFASASARKCVQAAISAESKTEFQGEPARSQIAVSPLSLQLPGATVYGIRLSGTLPAAVGGGSTRPPFQEDELGLQVGRLELILRATGAPQPVPSATERRLLALLLARAKAQGPPPQQ